jgi:type VI secretion system secreted protein Hcp
MAFYNSQAEETAMAIYMKLTLGKEIKGDVTAEGFEDWIGIQSWQYGSGRAVSMHVGSTANREASMPSLSEMSMSKSMDSSSGMLAQKALAGLEVGTAEIALVRTGGKGEAERVATFKLEGVVISGYSVSAGEGGAPQENFSLSYTKLEGDFVGSDPSHKNGKEMKFSYDLSTGKLS